MKPRRSQPFGDGRSGYARAADDWYVEEERAVEQLAAVEHFEGTVLDPACGCGTIPIALRKAGIHAIGTDLVDRGHGRGGVDFLSGRRRPVENIVCNPPFRLADAFVARALDLAQRKVAMLLRLAFLEGQERRANLYARTPPVRIWVFSWRVCMPPGALRHRAKREGGKMPYMWMVWERGPDGEWINDPPVGWL